MSQILERGAEVSAEEATLFEERVDDIAAEIAEIHSFVRARRAERLIDLSADEEVEDEEGGIVRLESMPSPLAAPRGYQLVDLRGRFCPAASSWANGPKRRGYVGHYNGDEVPLRAWQDPVAWIRFIISLHSQRGRFAPGWTINGSAYHEFIIGRVVYLVRNVTATLPHCGNLNWNRTSRAGHVIIGGDQLPKQAGDGTMVTFQQRADDHLRAMGRPRSALVGHREVGSSLCPGEPLMAGIRHYRSGADIGGGSGGEAGKGEPPPPPLKHGERMTRWEWCQDNAGPPATLTYDGEDAWTVQRVSRNPGGLREMTRWEWCQDNSAPAPVVLTWDGKPAWRVEPVEGSGKASAR